MSEAEANSRGVGGVCYPLLERKKIPILPTLDEFLITLPAGRINFQFKYVEQLSYKTVAYISHFLFSFHFFAFSFLCYTYKWKCLIYNIFVYCSCRLNKYKTNFREPFFVEAEGNLLFYFFQVNWILKGTVDFSSRDISFIERDPLNLCLITDEWYIQFVLFWKTQLWCFFVPRRLMLLRKKNIYSWVKKLVNWIW